MDEIDRKLLEVLGGHDQWCHGECCRPCTAEEPDCSVWETIAKIKAVFNGEA